MSPNSALKSVGVHVYGSGRVNQFLLNIIKSERCIMRGLRSWIGVGMISYLDDWVLVKLNDTVNGLRYLDLLMKEVKWRGLLEGGINFSA